MSKRNLFFLIAGLLTGLILRIVLLTQFGNADMQEYHNWGSRVCEQGLFSAYRGIYFPLQWQLFGLAERIAGHLQCSWVVVYKTVNLFFDVSTMLLLLSVLRKKRRNLLWILTYWLNPWFLFCFAHGFIDFQNCTFILLSILLLPDDLSDTVKPCRFFYAGIPLGIAFVLKPQVLMPYLLLSLYCIRLFLSGRNRHAWLICLPSVLFWVIYEILFTLSAADYVIVSRGISLPPFLILPFTYVSFGVAMPCLSASMMNFWYFISFCFKPETLPYYKFNVPAATIFTVILLFIFMFFIIKKLTERECGFSCQGKMLFLFFMTAFFAPFFMTSAHVNHPFLAFLLFTLLLFRQDMQNSEILAGGGLMLLSACAGASLYGLGSGYAVPAFANQFSRAFFSLGNTLCAAWLFFRLWKKQNF